MGGNLDRDDDDDVIPRRDFGEVVARVLSPHSALCWKNWYCNAARTTRSSFAPGMEMKNHRPRSINRSICRGRHRTCVDAQPAGIFDGLRASRLREELFPTCSPERKRVLVTYGDGGPRRAGWGFLSTTATIRYTCNCMLMEW